MLQKSERKYHDTFFIESFVDSELKALTEKYVNSDEAGVSYVCRHLLQAMERIERTERDYLNAISICHSRIQDMQSVLER